MIAKETERMVLKVPASWSRSWTDGEQRKSSKSMTGHEGINPQQLLYYSLQTYFGAEIDDRHVVDHLSSSSANGTLPKHEKTADFPTRVCQ